MKICTNDYKICANEICKVKVRVNKSEEKQLVQVWEIQVQIVKSIPHDTCPSAHHQQKQLVQVWEKQVPVVQKIEKPRAEATKV